jgi:hypothetical protein
MRKPPNETPEQREKRLRAQCDITRRYRLRHPILTAEQIEKRRANERSYRARKLAKDPVGTRKAAADAVRRYVARNPEKAKAATKKWRTEHKQQFNEMRRKWRSNNICRALLNEARSRAKTRGVEFSITVEDVPPMGERCPLLGHPFPPSDHRKTPFSPSLDRIDPSIGYIKGNVWIVGYRANLIKNDGTAEEHEMIARAIRNRGL